MHRLIPLLLAACGLFPSATALLAQDDFDREPINYSFSKPDNAVARAQAKIDKQELQLEWEPTFGYLRSVLTALDVPASSQMLVFSKTSLQRHRINPRTPRALYFNDDVYLGYCANGDLLEISVADGQLGTVYYAVKQSE